MRDDAEGWLGSSARKASESSYPSSRNRAVSADAKSDCRQGRIELRGVDRLTRASSHGKLIDGDRLAGESGLVYFSVAGNKLYQPAVQSRSFYDGPRPDGVSRHGRP